MLEAGVLLDKHGNILYRHEPSGRSSGFLPDSSELWNQIWDHRHNLSGFAHSHPEGCCRPSWEDLTTFEAVEAGLGVRLDWWIATDSTLSLVRWDAYARRDNPTNLGYLTLSVRFEPLWLAELREMTNYGEKTT